MLKQTLDVFGKIPLPWLKGARKKQGEVEMPYYGPLNDKQIAQLAKERAFITPFHERNVKDVQIPCPECGGEEGCPYCLRTAIYAPALSYGLSSFGYDFTLAPTVLLLENTTGEVFNVKAFDKDKHTRELPVVHDEYGQYVVLPPHSFALGHTAEYVNMPDDVMGICFDKSTYARIGGIQTNVTPIEPGWHGQITLEIRNTLPSFTRLYVNEGIIQTLFMRGMRPGITYEEKGGKYQGQEGVTGARV